MFVAVKIFLSALLIALASELGKRWTFASALLLALPLTSLIALSWTYYETRDPSRVAAMSWGVFWLVPPSLVFFPVFSFGLQKGWSFFLALAGGVIAAFITYLLYAKILSFFQISL